MCVEVNVSIYITNYELVFEANKTAEKRSDDAIVSDHNIELI